MKLLNDHKEQLTELVNGFIDHQVDKASGRASSALNKYGKKGSGLIGDMAKNVMNTARGVRDRYRMPGGRNYNLTTMSGQRPADYLLQNSGNIQTAVSRARRAQYK